MKMLYAFSDPKDVENESAIEHFAIVWRRTTEILREWEDRYLEKINQGEAFSKDQQACNDRSS